MHSPVIDHIEVVTRGDVRRAKLYYLRDLRGKKAKIKEKRDSSVAALAASRSLHCFLSSRSPKLVGSSGVK